MGAPGLDFETWDSPQWPVAANGLSITCLFLRYTALVHPNPMMFCLYPVLTCTLALRETTLYFSRIVPSSANPWSTVASKCCAMRAASAWNPSASSPAIEIQLVGAHPKGSSHCRPVLVLLIESPPGRSNRFSLSTICFASSRVATAAHMG